MSLAPPIVISLRRLPSESRSRIAPATTTFPWRRMHTRSQELDVTEDVAGEEDRAPSMLLFDDEVPNFLAPDRVEAAHRFVQDEELRVVDQRRGEGDTLQHSFGQRADGTVDCIPNAHAFDDLLDALA